MKKIIPIFVLVALAAIYVQAQRLDGGVRVNGNYVVPSSGVNGNCIRFSDAGDLLCRSGLGSWTMISGTGAGALTPVFNFGGTTSSFPALRRNGTNYEFVLADASAYAGISAASLGLKATSGAASNLIFNSTATAGLVQITDSAAANGIEINNGPASLTSCSTGALTAGSNANVGEITATGATSCQLNFTIAWTNVPRCFFNESTGARVLTYATPTVNSIVINGITANDVFSYYCLGRK